MKLEQLTYFLETARTEHIGKAAKALNISASAISHSIAQLEEELGRELFIKKGKNIILTSHGKVLMERTSQLLKDVQAIQSELKSDTAELQGNYKLAASHDLCTRFLSRAWALLIQKNARLSGEVFTFRSSQVVAGVVSGELDMGLCFNPVEHPDLISKKLHTGGLFPVVRKDHPIFRLKEAERLSALSRFPAALPKSFQGIDVCERHPMFEKFEIKLTPRFLYDSYSVGMNFVGGSDAWSLVPDWLIREHSSEVKALKVPTGWEASYFISAVWSKDRIQTDAMKQLLSQVSTILKTIQ